MRDQKQNFRNLNENPISNCKGDVVALAMIPNSLFHETKEDIQWNVHTAVFL